MKSSNKTPKLNDIFRIRYRVNMGYNSEDDHHFIAIVILLKNDQINLKVVYDEDKSSDMTIYRAIRSNFYNQTFFVPEFLGTKETHPEWFL